MTLTFFPPKCDHVDVFRGTLDTDTGEFISQKPNGC